MKSINPNRWRNLERPTGYGNSLGKMQPRNNDQTAKDNRERALARERAEALFSCGPVDPNLWKGFAA